MCKVDERRTPGTCSKPRISGTVTPGDILHIIVPAGGKRTIPYTLLLQTISICNNPISNSDPLGLLPVCLDDDYSLCVKRCVAEGAGDLDGYCGVLEFASFKNHQLTLVTLMTNRMGVLAAALEGKVVTN